MRPALPEKLGGSLWFLLFMMIGFGFTALFLAWFLPSPYEAAVGCLIGTIYCQRLVQHVRAVRLGRALKNDPEMSEIYYGRKR